MVFRVCLYEVAETQAARADVRETLAFEATSYFEATFYFTAKSPRPRPSPGIYQDTAEQRNLLLDSLNTSTFMVPNSR